MYRSGHGRGFDAANQGDRAQITPPRRHASMIGTAEAEDYKTGFVNLFLIRPGQAKRN
jgi:hypothetical protein